MREKGLGARIDGEGRACCQGCGKEGDTGALARCKGCECVWYCDKVRSLP